MHVAALGRQRPVVLKPVTVGRNFGNHVEIQSGVSLSDRLSTARSNRLQTGDVVNVGAAAATPPAPESTASAKAALNKRPDL